MIKIFIDQGHNPSTINAGASAEGVNEADITYQVGIYLAQLLNNDVRFEARVSRPLEDSVLGTTIRESLQTRVDLANEWEADYFISIHANANTNTNIQGAEVYLYQNRENTDELAQNILDGMRLVTQIRDNGVRVNSSLYVLRNTNMPALLVELGYLTNEEDRQKLTNDTNGFAQGIYLGISDYFE